MRVGVKIWIETRVLHAILNWSDSPWSDSICHLYQGWNSNKHFPFIKSHAHCFGTNNAFWLWIFASRLYNKCRFLLWNALSVGAVMLIYGNAHPTLRCHKPLVENNFIIPLPYNLRSILMSPLSEILFFSWPAVPQRQWVQTYH